MIYHELTDEQFTAIDALLAPIELSDAAWHQISFFYNHETGSVTCLAAFPVRTATHVTVIEEQHGC